MENEKENVVNIKIEDKIIDMIDEATDIVKNFYERYSDKVEPNKATCLAIAVHNTLPELLELYHEANGQIKQFYDGELYTANQLKNIEKTTKTYYIHKDKIRDFIKSELPDDDICEACETYDVNGVDIKKELKKLLEEN